MEREMKVEKQKKTTCSKVAALFCAAVLILCVSILPASAEIVAGTDSFPENVGIGYAPDIDGFGSLSFSFTTDANDYTFNSVTLLLGNGWSNGTGSFYVTLNENEAGAPGEIVEFLDGDDDPTGDSITQYQYSGSSTLTANTTYWISLINIDETGDNYYDFLVAGSTAESAASVWSIGDGLYSSVEGGLMDNPDAAPFASVFDATPNTVPIPGSALLLITGLVGLAGLRRK